MNKRNCSCHKGTVLTKCFGTSDAVCKPCPADTYMDVENREHACFPCQHCSKESNLQTDSECVANRNRQCRCKTGFYCKDATGSQCHLCVAISTCGLGSGVSENYTFLSDTVCSSCPAGTFSDVDDYVSICKNHTSCDRLNRVLKAQGTEKSDAECGDFKASCPLWLPASLWLGLVLTVIIVCLLLFFYWRCKRHSQRANINYSSTLLELPPDILKYPADSRDVEKQAECGKLTHENYYLKTCDIIDGNPDRPATLMTTEETNQSAVSIMVTDNTMLFQSEPQESEWND